MSVFDQLQAPSFKGVNFLVSQEETNEGPKIAVHEYVNSNRRFVEEFGDMPSTFSVSGYVTGDDALQKRDQLRNALREGGVGELVLPSFGTFQVKAGPYSVKNKMTDLGRVDFTMTFYRSDADIFPTEDENTQSALGEAAQENRDAMGENLANTLEKPTTEASQAALEDKGLSVADAFDSILSAASGPTDLINEATRQVANIRNNIASLVQAPDQYAAALTDFYNTTAGLDLQLSSLAGQFGFGDGDTLSSPTTQDRINRNNSLTATNEFVKVLSFVSAYEQAGRTEFTDGDSLAEAKEILANGYESIREAELLQKDQDDENSASTEPFNNTNINSNRSDTAIDNFNRVRNIGEAILNAKNQSTSQIVEVDTSLTSVSLLTYQYYGNLDNVDTIASLNSDKNLGQFQGTARVIE